MLLHINIAVTIQKNVSHSECFSETIFSIYISNSVSFEYKAIIKLLFEPLAQLTPKYVTPVTSQLYIFL